MVNTNSFLCVNKHLLRFLMLQKTPDVSLLSSRCSTSSAGNSGPSGGDLLKPTTKQHRSVNAVGTVRSKVVPETRRSYSTTALWFSERTPARHVQHWYFVVRSKHVCWICSRCYGISQMFCRSHIGSCLREESEPEDFISLGRWDKHFVKVLEMRRPTECV